MHSIDHCSELPIDSRIFKLSTRNDRDVENRLTPKAQEFVMLINFTCYCGSLGFNRSTFVILLVLLVVITDRLGNSRLFWNLISYFK